MNLNASIASLNSTAFLNKSSLGLAGAIKINTGLHNLSACPGAVPAHLASKLKQIPTENIKVQSGHILAYFNQTSRLVISRLRLTKQHPRSTTIEVQVPNSENKLSIENFCIADNGNTVIVFSGPTVFSLKQNGNSVNLPIFARNDEKCGIEFVEASGYQGYIYLTSKCGSLFKFDSENKELTEIGVVEEKTNPNVSIFSRMTSSFFAAGQTTSQNTLIDTDFDEVLKTCFYMDFGFIITKSKIVRINLNDMSSDRVQWKLNSDNLQVFDGCILGTKIFLLTGNSATSAPSDLRAIDLDFDRPNPSIYRVVFLKCRILGYKVILGHFWGQKRDLWAKIMLFFGVFGSKKLNYERFQPFLTLFSHFRDIFAKPFCTPANCRET